MSEIVKTYSVAYKESVFACWYRNGKPGVVKLVSIIPDDENGRKPSTSILSKWVEEGDWNTRADILDTEASENLNKALILDRVDMFKKHAQIGQELQDFGLEYLRKHGIKSDTSAIKAVIDGAQLEKESVGLSIALSKIYALGDSEISSEIRRLLSRAGSGDILDGETVEENETE